MDLIILISHIGNNFKFPKLTGIFKCTYIIGSYKRWGKEKNQEARRHKSKTKRKENNFHFKSDWFKRKHRNDRFQYYFPVLSVRNQMVVFQMNVLLYFKYFISSIKTEDIDNIPAFWDNILKTHLSSLTALWEFQPAHFSLLLYNIIVIHNLSCRDHSYDVGTIDKAAACHKNFGMILISCIPYPCTKKRKSSICLWF